MKKRIFLIAILIILGLILIARYSKFELSEISKKLYNYKGKYNTDVEEENLEVIQSQNKKLENQGTEKAVSENKVVTEDNINPQFISTFSINNDETIDITIDYVKFESEDINLDELDELIPTYDDIYVDRRFIDDYNVASFKIKEGDLFYKIEEDIRNKYVFKNKDGIEYLYVEIMSAQSALDVHYYLGANFMKYAYDNIHMFFGLNEPIMYRVGDSHVAMIADFEGYDTAVAFVRDAIGNIYRFEVLKSEADIYDIVANLESFLSDGHKFLEDTHRHIRYDNDIANVIYLSSPKENHIKSVNN